MTRLLLIADEACDRMDAMPDRLRDLAEGADHVDVIAPTTGTRLETLTEDESIYREADARAERVAGWFGDAGAEVTAAHSESAPLETATAALSKGSYDSVVVLTTGEDHWREDGLLEELRSATTVDVHEIQP